jgi:transcriptional regulator with XRE-family HTH domain
MLLTERNSNARGAVYSAAITLRGMGKRRALTSEETADAARLRAVWERQRKILHLTQEKVAADCGWTQGAFNQYLRGFIALKLPSALKIANALEVDLEDISPRLAASLPARTHSVGEHPVSYANSGRTQNNQKRTTWLKLFDDLDRLGLADAAIRMLRPLASQLQRKGRKAKSAEPARIKNAK